MQKSQLRLLKFHTSKKPTMRRSNTPIRSEDLWSNSALGILRVGFALSRPARTRTCSQTQSLVRTPARTENSSLLEQSEIDENNGHAPSLGTLQVGFALRRPARTRTCGQTRSLVGTPARTENLAYLRGWRPSRTMVMLTRLVPYGLASHSRYRQEPGRMVKLGRW